MPSPILLDLNSRTAKMAEKKKRKWVQKADLDKGAFTSKAKRAGKTVATYAHEKANAPGKLGKQARLAETFEGMAKKRKKMYDNSRSRKD